MKPEGFGAVITFSPLQNHSIMIKELSEVLAGLASPIPYDLCTAQPRWIKKKWDGQWVTYLIGTSKDAYIQMLNEHAPGWSSKFVHPPRLFSEDLVQATCEITIPVLISGQVHMITRSAVGIVQLEGGQVSGGYGNPVSNCATSAFKKAAKAWGVASAFQKPSIMMRIESWEVPNQKPRYPKYDPDKAGSPWYTRNQNKVPDDVRAAMRAIRNPRNKQHNATATGQAAPPENEPASPRLPEFPSMAGLLDICGIKDVDIALVGIVNIEPEESRNKSFEKLLRALVKSRPEWKAAGRRAFLLNAQREQVDLTSPKKLEAALVIHEAQMLGGGV